MKRMILFIIFIGLTIHPIEIGDFISAEKIGKFNYKLTEYNNDKIVNTGHFTMIFERNEKGKDIKMMRDGKVEFEIILGNNNEIISGRLKEKEIDKNMIHIKKTMKLKEEKMDNIFINGKRINAKLSVFDGDTTHRLTKNNLVLETYVFTTEKIWEDESGLPLKIEKVKEIKRETYHKLKPEKVLQRTDTRIKEIIEIEDI
uniref:Uncharacterized protein n=1 Tax=candidate division WOR-3 bacterium TaxID=2052148 RepID=A0A7C4UCV8_UNCW3